MRELTFLSHAFEVSLFHNIKSHYAVINAINASVLIVADLLHHRDHAVGSRLARV